MHLVFAGKNNAGHLGMSLKGNQILGVAHREPCVSGFALR